MQVYVKYIGVRAKNHIDSAQTANLAFSNEFKPTVIEKPVFVFEADVLKKIPYHLRKFVKRRKSTTKIGIEINNFYLYDLNGQ